jgi:hypothetical protein
MCGGEVWLGQNEIRSERQDIRCGELSLTGAMLRYNSSQQGSINMLSIRKYLCKGYSDTTLGTV